MQLEIGKTIRIINFLHILLILNFYLWGEIVVQTCKANQKIMFGGNLKIIKHLSSLLCNIYCGPRFYAPFLASELIVWLLLIF
jgi:hypothetical protein